MLNSLIFSATVSAKTKDAAVVERNEWAGGVLVKHPPTWSRSSDDSQSAGSGGGVTVRPFSHVGGARKSAAPSVRRGALVDPTTTTTTLLRDLSSGSHFDLCRPTRSRHRWRLYQRLSTSACAVIDKIFFLLSWSRVGDN